MAELCCETCQGTGWNQAIREQPVDITASVTGDRRSLKTLKDYIHSRLCCPDCDGTGKVNVPPGRV